MIEMIAVSIYPRSRKANVAERKVNHYGKENHIVLLGWHVYQPARQ
jgi:hypothetical protein